VTTIDLARRLATHMETHVPDTEYAGGWTVARDQRDNTAVVVWRGDEPVQPQVRGMTLYRWLCSLRLAGFTAEARTDMAVFGRPGDQSPDGIAHWLHVTGWSAPAPVAAEPLAPLPPQRPRVTVPLPHGRVVCPLTGVSAAEAQFTYRPDGGVEVVLHFETPDLDWAQLEPRPPAWLLDIARMQAPDAARATKTNTPGGTL
jgi:hypothetical protein